MKNKKGFTLIELIVTIGLIAMLFIIAIPTSIKFIQRGKNQQYQLLEDQIMSAASKYYVKHKNETCITLDKLINDIDNKFLDGPNIVDPRTKQNITKKIKVNKNNNNVKYILVNNCS